ncbi:SAP30-binding protein isoform X2 [Punica granatum]|uniref:SAP30-binding protein isoform X2 n=2 Tax=Punica granatum TaxID=22663 RepID=A0A218WR73_PUNGR|nr:SAP30-binding protein isoform X2 [Punica granatum]OWM75305.1 hypothetical protein CDL15_Pgr012265 [Punica granatum]
MASKKASEGIALLSMYNDEEDEEMEDVKDGGNPQTEDEQGEKEPRQGEDEYMESSYREDEIRVTPHSSDHQQDQPQLDTPNQDSIDSGASEAKDTAEVSKDVDPLDKFIPPPPTTKCSEELQERVRKFIAYKRAGKSFNSEVRNRKDYRNPDFLLHAVRYQDIDQTGSCFSKDVFDPHGYDPSDYYDEIEIDMKREAERKELEKKKSQQVEFVSGGAQITNLAAAPKINLPVPVPNVNVTVALRSASAAPDAVPREGRQNKKSKWDKVDTGGQDALSNIGAHAALLSASNAGSGYPAFVQQRRRAVEEKRSGERKLDKRT